MTPLKPDRPQCHFVHDKHIYTASADTVIGGITCYRNVNDNFIKNSLNYLGVPAITFGTEKASPSW